jgi:outer membrane lipoprotein LolB
MRLAAAAILASCAAPAPGPGAGAYLGRFSLQASTGTKSDAWSGRYTLQVQAGIATLDLTSPIGATLARCEWGGALARISVPAAGGLRTELGPDPQELSQRILGWPLPLAMLADWIEGRPGAGAPYGVRVDEDTVQEFSQGGWSVRAERETRQAPPRRLELSREPADPSEPRVRVRVLPDAR